MFQENDKVLCFHGAQLYEAKVLETRETQGNLQYYIHYKGKSACLIQGWKNTWDEWLGEERVLEFNEDNLNKQAELANSSNVNKNGKRIDSNQVLEKKKKRKDSVLAEKEEEFLKKPMIHIPIPDSLKLKLVQDWENVTKSQKLVSLPRSPTVSGILDGFFKEYLEQLPDKPSREGRSVASHEIVREVVEGLKLYFDKSLGSILLYKLERAQYLDVLNGDESIKMSEFYGAEHLLRLFVQLPSLIVHTNMDVDATNVLKDHLVMVLEYMDKNQQEFFLKEYETAQPSYLSRADES